MGKQHPRSLITSVTTNVPGSDASTTYRQVSELAFSLQTLIYNNIHVHIFSSIL